MVDGCAMHREPSVGAAESGRGVKDTKKITEDFLLQENNNENH